MLSETNISIIVKLLRDASEAHLKRAILPPNNVQHLMSNTEALELRALIETIDDMLGDPSYFVDRFKQLCLLRATGAPESVPVMRAPGSPSNLLLIRIARVLFQEAWIPVLLPIATPTKILRLMPGPLQSDGSLESVKLALKRGGRVWVEESLATLNVNLHDCVITPDAIFPMTEINAAPFETQIEIYDALRACPYNLFDHVYNRNSDWVELKNDIESLHYGISVREALENLVNTFEKGGSSVTGNEFAARQSVVTFLQFSEGYLSRLPIAIRDAVLLLQCVHNNKTQTLAQILQAVKQGGCTEMASAVVKTLLSQNQQDPIVNWVSNRVTDLGTLRAKYRSKGPLASSKPTRIDDIARRFAQDNVHGLNLRDLNYARQFFATFPMAAYPLLWNAFRLQHADSNANIEAIMASLDTRRQQALLEVIASTIRSFNQKVSVLGFLVRYSHPELEAKLVQSLSPNESQFLVFTENQNTETLLMKSFSDGDLSIFASIPQEFAYGALTHPNRNQLTAVHYIRTLAFLTRVLQTLSENQRARLLSTVPGRLQLSPANMTELTEFFRLFLTAANINKAVGAIVNSSSLIVRVNNLEEIETFLSHFPDSVIRNLKVLLLLRAYIVMEDGTITPLLRWYANQPYSAFSKFIGPHQEVILKLLESKMTVLKDEFGEFLDKLIGSLKYSDYWTPQVILRACNTPGRLKMLFHKIPFDRRRAYFTWRDGDGNTILMNSLHNVDLVHALLDFDTNHKLREYLFLKNSTGVNAFNQAMNSHKDSFDRLLTRLGGCLVPYHFVSRTTGQSIGFWRYLFEEPSLCVQLLEEADSNGDLLDLAVMYDVEGISFLRFILENRDDNLLENLFQHATEGSLQRFLEIFQAFVASASPADMERLEALLIAGVSCEEQDGTGLMNVLLEDDSLSDEIQNELHVLHQRWSRQKLRRVGDAEEIDQADESEPMSFTHR